MEKNCSQCSAPFVVTQNDLQFYEKVSPVFAGKKEMIPAPTLCPDCRSQRRLSWRNNRKLYHRKCDLTGKQIISIYSPDKPYTIYDQKEWSTDVWDATSFGREFDFNRPFFEQYADLLKLVPIPSLHLEQSENSDYANFCWGAKDCYLVFATDQSQDCYYCTMLFYCNDCVDCSFCVECKFCYQLLDCENCYRCFYSQDLSGCDSVDFSIDCKNCKNCFGCTGLRNKQYHMFNEALSKEEYERRLAELTLTENAISAAKERARELWIGHPRLYARLLQCEGCTGDNLLQCKNCTESFEGKQAQDCKFAQNMPNDSKDCYDVYGAGYGAELVYEAYSIAGQRVLFSYLIYPSGNDIYYSSLCGSCENIFGCIGLKRKKYCILNKQYTKEEYEALMPKIIDNMRKTGEWGQFFPVHLSPFCYNETIAGEYFPLSKADAAKNRWKWFDESATEQYLGPSISVPESIDLASDDITKQILTCSVTGKPYKIIPQELKFYREMRIPVPTKCPDQRHLERMALRNPRKLWERSCDNCKTEIETTYEPNRPETVYCEKCYLSTVY